MSLIAYAQYRGIVVNLVGYAFGETKSVVDTFL